MPNESPETITPPIDPPSTGATPTGRVADLEAELERTKAALAEAERARAIQSALADARATDLDATSLLLEQARAGAAGKNIPVEQLVRELKRRKPHLFAPSGGPGAATGAMSASIGAAPAAGIDELAHAAAATGNRRGLLAYLRARRGS